MNAYFSCLTLGQSPTHAIVTAESVAALAGLVGVFVAYAKHQAAARNPAMRAISPRVLRAAISIWAAIVACIPVAVNALYGTGWPPVAICAPAAIVQCVAWFGVLLVCVAAIVSRDTFAHLAERRAAGQPAFASTVPMSRPYRSVPLAPESQLAPHALRALLDIQDRQREVDELRTWPVTVPLDQRPAPSSTERQRARADAAAWARPGAAGRFLNSK